MIAEVRAVQPVLQRVDKTSQNFEGSDEKDIAAGRKMGGRRIVSNRTSFPGLLSSTIECPTLGTHLPKAGAIVASVPAPPLISLSSGNVAGTW